MLVPIVNCEYYCQNVLDVLLNMSRDRIVRLGNGEYQDTRVSGNVIDKGLPHLVIDGLGVGIPLWVPSPRRPRNPGNGRPFLYRFPSLLIIYNCLPDNPIERVFSLRLRL